MRNLTARDQIVSRRLFNYWAAKKRDLGITQEAVSQQLGITQAAFSQMLRCRMAISTEMLIKLANLFEISPTNLNPFFYRELGCIDTRSRLEFLSREVATLPYDSQIELAQRAIQQAEASFSRR